MNQALDWHHVIAVLCVCLCVCVCVCVCVCMQETRKSVIMLVVLSWKEGIYKTSVGEPTANKQVCVYAVCDMRGV